MRPRSLQLAGFTTFRSPTEIDFDDVDLFVLTGPTGSGKSSVIDAICFALYGSVPRLRRIAPVISLGRNEARVKLEFEVDGTRYTVSRLVTRQGDGATQKDVRLEGPGLAVAGVRDVDAHIEALLGLGFEHFTRCVVLPQGRFAAFLEDAPADRDKLLKQLLDLGVYEEMRKLAAGHAGRLEGEEAALTAQLHDLTVEAGEIAAQERRRDELAGLLTRVVEIQDRLDASTAERATAEAEHSQVTGAIAGLDAVDRPADLDRLAGAVEAAVAAATTATDAVARAETALEELRARQAALGEVSFLDGVIQLHGRAAELGERVARGQQMVADTTAARDEEVRASESADQRLAAAVDRHRDLQRLHAAHALRLGLTTDQPCPVCLQEIAHAPDVQAPAELEGAIEEELSARAAVESATASRQKIESELAAQVALLAQRQVERDEVVAELAGLPSSEDAAAAREQAVHVAAEVDAATRSLQAVRRTASEAEEARSEAVRRAASASAALDRARDRVAALEPPIPGREDVAADWAVFTEWRDATRDSLRARASVLAESIAAHLARSAELTETIHADARTLGVDTPDTGLRDMVVGEVASAEARLESMRRDLDRKASLGKRLDDVRGRRGRYVATELHLRSNRFQQWLIEEAMVSLVEFANEQLAELASGSYSLAYDGSEFEVIDHRNADARRSVRTLSGGETFLVSLALALALAERVVATSAVGTARIESMFLDEGFGTLDAETLETVATVVTELGSRDRMVGLITHVRELAEQIPVRFEVRKLPDGSVVSRVTG